MMALTSADSICGRESTLSVTAGLFFFIWMGVNHASSAPRRIISSWTCPRTSGVMSSMFVSMRETWARASLSWVSPIHRASTLGMSGLSLEPRP